MSRSRKKPSYSDYSRYCTRFQKRLASKTVRRYKGYISNGSSYKKLFCSWNIFDYKGLWHPLHPNDPSAYLWEEGYKKSVRK